MVKQLSKSKRTRRDVLIGAAGLAGAVAVSRVFVMPAAATPAEMETAIRATIGEASMQKGKVTLELPPLIDNGNTVSCVVTVDHPMTETSYVKSIHIFNEKNPQPNVANFHLNPRCGKAAVSTRIRLADTQFVTAIARLSDGSVWFDRVHAIVTLAACLEE